MFRAFHITPSESHRPHPSTNLCSISYLIVVLIWEAIFSSLLKGINELSGFKFSENQKHKRICQNTNKWNKKCVLLQLKEKHRFTFCDLTPVLYL